MQATMQILARGYGDRAARNRLNSDITLREPKPPQGNVIVTAEFAPDIGESGTARLFCIEMKPGTIDLPLLTEAQENARDGCFTRCMGRYLRYLQETFLSSGKEEMLRDLFAEHFPKFREGWRDDLKEKNIPFHNRLPDTLACLAFTLLALHANSHNVALPYSRVYCLDYATAIPAPHRRTQYQSIHKKRLCSINTPYICNYCRQYGNSTD